ncbi:MAG: PKD domain-containing protein [Brumimicrobium sp.]|nr:PKD domain-containing protein [Brumimicrobium sp.]
MIKNIHLSFLYVLFFFLAITNNLSAQSATNCLGANPFCTDQSYNFPNNINTGVGPSNINYNGCNTTPFSGFGPSQAPNPIWYYFQIDQPGTISLSLHQYNNNGQGIDTDFMLWGPFSSVSNGCAQINNGLATIECGISADYFEEITLGLPGGSDNNLFGGTQHGIFTPPTAQNSGDIYIVMITNFENQSGYFTFEQTGGTGSADCSVVIPCDIASVTATPSACDSYTNTFSVSGTVTFTDAPTSGSLIIKDCNGNQTTLNAPFTSPANFTISNIQSDGQPCQLTAYFSEEPNCTKTSNTYNNPPSCSCGASTGTFTTTINGNGQTNYILCFGDEITIQADGNWVPPSNVGNDPSIPVIYDPGLAFLAYSCPPTVYPPNNFQTDPCYIGVFDINTNGITDINNGPFTNGVNSYTTIYIVPVTLYDKTNLVYTYDVNAPPCFALGTPIPITHLTEITSSNPTENCQDGSFTVTLNGGWPELDNSKHYISSNLLPTTASFVNTNTSNGGTIKITGLQNGDMYSFSVTDDNGCPITISGGPFEGGPTISTVITDASCVSVCDGAITVNTSGTTGQATLSWMMNGSPYPGTNNTASNLCVGDYTILVSDDSGCSVTTQASIQAPTIDASFSFDGFCEGTSNGPSNIVTPGGTFTFNPPVSDGATIHAATGEITNGVSGTTYIIEYTINAGACSTSSTQNVTIYANPTPDFHGENLTGCNPLEVKFINETEGSNSNCLWNFGDGISLNNCNQSVYHTFTNSGSYNVSLTVTNTTGCMGTITLYNYVLVLPQPKADFSHTPNIITNFENEVQFIDQSIDADSYSWTFGDNTTSSDNNPIHQYETAQMNGYIVTLAVTSSDGCIDSIKVYIPVREIPIYYVPNTFTPDGNSYNDVFHPIFTEGFDQNNYHFSIFDRWGELIFESSDFKAGWDGTYLGKKVPDGTYVWKIRYGKVQVDEPLEIIGHVNLIR